MKDRLLGSTASVGREGVGLYAWKTVGVGDDVGGAPAVTSCRATAELNVGTSVVVVPAQCAHAVVDAISPMCFEVVGAFGAASFK